MINYKIAFETTNCLRPYIETLFAQSKIFRIFANSANKR
jgi:hypothetical protein